jgi:hypothetical protein
MPFALMSEARDPTRIVVGAIVITADEEDPVFARVHAITTHGDGPAVVHLELLPGGPLDYADALRRSHLMPAETRALGSRSSAGAPRRTPRQEAQQPIRFSRSVVGIGGHRQSQKNARVEEW